MSRLTSRYWAVTIILCATSLWFLYGTDSLDSLIRDPTRSSLFLGNRWTSPYLASDIGGIVIVPSGGSALHPILELIEHGKRVAKRVETIRQSVKSLDDAVRDYKKAFRMNPPEGFDRWYELAVKVNGTTAPSLIPFAVNSVLPFLSLPPALLRKRVKEVIPLTAMCGLIVRPESSKNQTYLYHTDVITRQRPTPNQWKKLIKEDIDSIPISQNTSEPMQIAFWTDDWGFRKVERSLLDASERLALRGEIWDENELFARESTSASTTGWSSTCPTEAKPMPYSAKQTGQEQKRFALELDRAGDHCIHPELIQQNGELMMREEHVLRPLVPVIAVSKPQHGADILGPPTLRHDSIVEDPLPWAERVDKRLLWRGQVPGLYHIDRFPWRHSHRDRLSLSTDYRQNGTTTLLRDSGLGSRTDTQAWNRSELVRKYLNIGLVKDATPWHCGRWGSELIYCHQEDLTFPNCPGGHKACKEMEKELQWKDRIEVESAQRYKFILDVDGYGWSSRFRKELSSGSVIIKTTIYKEWWSQQGIPWYHYVPSLYDYSDLFDIMAFFTGSPDGKVQGHDNLAEEIAKQGRDFAMDRLRWEDMRVYMLLMVLEYRRAWSDDRIAATFQTGK